MIDLIIHSASNLVTVAGAAPKAGRRQADVAVIENGAVAVEGGIIRLVGPSDAVLRASERAGIDVHATILNAAHRTVLPGFVDPHTHLVFAGSREDEFELRLQGLTYLEIASQGGGILRTVRDTRATSEDDLRSLTRQRLDTMLRLGSTTVEAKSGYGLSLSEELRILRVIRALAREHPIRLVSTFLGAHAVPPEYADRPDAYVDLIVHEMLPEIAQLGLAQYCDVFCDAGAFTLEQSRRILVAARSLGLGLKLHAGEFVSLGAGRLGASLGAASIDHAVVMAPEEMEAIADSGIVVVLLPATTFHLGHSNYAPARDYIAAGIPVSIGTDLNPGTSMTESMALTVAVACTQMRMTPAEAIVAATLNAAHAVGLSPKVGSLEEGKSADMVVIDAPNYRHIAYHWGVNLVETVVQRGRVFLRNEVAI